MNYVRSNTSLFNIFYVYSALYIIWIKGATNIYILSPKFKNEYDNTTKNEAVKYSILLSGWKTEP